MKTIAIVQARLSSRRFDRKVLADLNGHPLIWHVVSRVSQVKGLDRIVLATPAADAAELGAAVVGLPCEVIPAQTTPVRWHEDGSVAAWDCLGAFAAVAADLKNYDVILRATGDCPALDPEAVRLTVETLQERAFHFDDIFAVSESPHSGWPDGSGAEACYVQSLRDAARSAVWLADREHPTRWLYRHHTALVVENPHGDFGHLKLSVDRIEDLTAVREYLQAHLSEPDSHLTSEEG